MEIYYNICIDYLSVNCDPKYLVLLWYFGHTLLVIGIQRFARSVRKYRGKYWNWLLSIIINSCANEVRYRFLFGWSVSPLVCLSVSRLQPVGFTDYIGCCVSIPWYPTKRCSCKVLSVFNLITSLDIEIITQICITLNERSILSSFII